MSEGMRQGQKEHLGPRGSLWTALGSHGKLRFVCISSELGPTPPPTNTSVTARLIPLPKAPPEA